MIHQTVISITIGMNLSLVSVLSKVKYQDGIDTVICIWMYIFILLVSVICMRSGIGISSARILYRYGGIGRRVPLLRQNITLFDEDLPLTPLAQFRRLFPN